MLNFLRSLQEKWTHWTGDRELELAIRRHLTDNGHYGGMAKLQNVRLAAVQRPGWLQVYRFDAVARVIPALLEDDDGPEPPAVHAQLYGLVREDARHHQTTIRTFDSVQARRELFAQWSAGMIQLRSGRSLD